MEPLIQTLEKALAQAKNLNSDYNYKLDRVAVDIKSLLEENEELKKELVMLRMRQSSST
jgi:hypothetical protein